MAELVGGEVPHSRPLGVGSDEASEIGRIDRPPQSVGEDQPVAFPDL